MAVKYGLKQQLTNLVDKNKQFVENTDKEGNFPVHWAGMACTIYICYLFLNGLFQQNREVLRC